MVVFTCNHCGESVQKPRVAKHQAVCRNPISLTCVDCFKDFRLQEYAVHTKCITEVERYSAKGSVVKVQKGELKQTEWVNTVNTIIKQQENATFGIKQILGILTNYDNIPRKKAKFINFLTNSSGYRVKLNDVEAVWDILQAHKNSIAKNNETTKTNDESKKDETIQPQNSEVDEKVTSSKKKKRQSKSEEIDTINDNEEVSKKKKAKTNNDVVETENSSSSKKKKKRKSIPETEELQQDNLTMNGNEEASKQDTSDVVETENSSSKKKKKRKSIPETEELQDNLTNGNEETPNKKKKSEEEVVETDNSSSKKKKKRKSIPDAEETVENNEITEQNVANNLEDSQNESFSFKQVIIDILQKKTNGISKEDLQTKVFKKYEKLQGPVEDDNKEILLKKYNNKLKSLKNVTVENDKYKLVA